MTNPNRIAPDRAARGGVWTRPKATGSRGRRIIGAAASVALVALHSGPSVNRSYSSYKSYTIYTPYLTYKSCLSHKVNGPIRSQNPNKTSNPDSPSRGFIMYLFKRVLTPPVLSFRIQQVPMP